MYKPTIAVSGQIGHFFLLHHSNFPDSACCFGDPFSSNPIQEPPVARATADLGFELIMQKFSASLIPDQLTRFEVNGSEFLLKVSFLQISWDEISRKILVNFFWNYSSYIW